MRFSTPFFGYVLHRDTVHLRRRDDVILERSKWTTIGLVVVGSLFSPATPLVAIYHLRQRKRTIEESAGRAG